MQCLGQNEAARPETRAATTTRRTRQYIGHVNLSTPSSDFFRRQATEAAEAVGALLLYLIGRKLPQREREIGWHLAERWAGQLGEARHGTREGVAE